MTTSTYQVSQVVLQMKIMVVSMMPTQCLSVLLCKLIYCSVWCYQSCLN